MVLSIDQWDLALATIICFTCFAGALVIVVGFLVGDNKMVVGKQKKRVAKAEADYRIAEWKEQELMVATKATALVNIRHRLAMGEGDDEKVLKIVAEEEQNQKYKRDRY